jgi:hypothetical protein
MDNVISLHIFDPIDGLICTLKYPTIEASMRFYNSISSDPNTSRYRLVLIGPNGNQVEGEALPNNK